MGGSTTAPSWNTSSHRKNGNFQAALVPYQAEKRWKDQSWWMKKWEVGSRLWYCWWKKSQTTTLDVQNPVNNGINYLSDGAGFLPSTVGNFDLILSSMFYSVAMGFIGARKWPKISGAQWAVDLKIMLWFFQLIGRGFRGNKDERHGWWKKSG